jgi:hypothetical protein
MLIIVQRQKETGDGIFGILSVNDFQCFTVENRQDIIPAGTYSVEFTYSPAFNRILPLLDVSGRTAIRIHPANFGSELLGCIGVGDKEEPDAVDNSRVTFNQLFKIINGTKDLQIQIKDIEAVA